MDYQMKQSTSCFTHPWRLWRHCLCRHGWFPLLVAPIVTVGVLLSVYSSLGCDFLIVNIGFTPSNFAWNQTSINMGLFHFRGGDTNVNDFSRPFAHGCSSYSTAFDKSVISVDRVWKTARVLATIAGSSGIVAMAISWLMVVTPLPAAFIWPGCLLPLIIVAFLAEGTKLIFIDSNICQTKVWYPSGVDSLPQKAQSCSLGKTGYYTIAAVTIFLISFLMICFSSPKKRVLDENYGISYHLEEGSEQGSCPETTFQGEEAIFIPTIGNEGYILRKGNPRQPSTIGKSRGESSYDDHSFEEGTYVSNDSQRSSPNNIVKEEGISRTIGSFDCMATTSPSLVSNHHPTMESSSDGGSHRDDIEEPSNGRKLIMQEARDDDASHTDQPILPKKPTVQASNTKIPSPVVRISDSRLSRAEKLQLATQTKESSELIDKFVMDLDKAFQVES